MSEDSLNNKDLVEEVNSRNELTSDAVPLKDIVELADFSKAFTERARTEIKLTQDEAKAVLMAMDQKFYLGDHASLPMVCLGPKCMMRENCPLQAIGKAPVGQMCPIEMALMSTWKAQYESSLGADWNDKVERQAVMDLVEADILSARANSIIAVEGFIMENAIGVSEETGEAIMRKEKHVALDVKDMVHKRKERLLKSLVMTREMKKKLGIGGGDPSRKEADILERARKSRERERVQNAEVIK